MTLNCICRWGTRALGIVDTSSLLLIQVHSDLEVVVPSRVLPTGQIDLLKNP